MVVIPATILAFTGLDTFDLSQSYPATHVALLILGSVLICLGIVLMVATIRLFVTVGKVRSLHEVVRNKGGAEGFSSTAHVRVTCED